MKRSHYLILIILLSVWDEASCQDENKPKLTVLIGLDQFRAGYLVRCNEAFTGGFRRMIDEGLCYQKGMVDHAPTLSMPGHATLATGANPKTHGITSNSWIDMGQIPDDSGRIRGTYPHVDRNETIIGNEGAIGFSSSKVKVTGLADWFRESDAEARTVSLSVTPLAVVYGGKLEKLNPSNYVYWLGSSGKFVTSTYYRKSDPNWIKDFNETIGEKYASNHVWENSVPIQFQKLAREDSAIYEFDGINISFPHKAESFMSEVNEQYYNWWFGRFSPYQNNALFDLAKESVRELKLGQRQSSDFLSIAVKLTDRIGHDFGPMSMEQLDVVIRLDRLLGEFFEYLDKTVGQDNYVVALSADHGAPNVTEYEQSQGRESKRITSTEISEALKGVELLIEGHTSNKKELPELIASKLEEYPFISRAMTREDLMNSKSEDPYTRAYANSFLQNQPTAYPLWTDENKYGNLISTKHPAYYGVIADVSYNANIWSASSTHGGSHNYDKEVPIIFMGAGIIKKGVSSDQAFTKDIAPTLAKIAGIRIPKTVDGKILSVE